MEYCYVEFIKKNDEKLNRLISIVEIMKKDMAEGRTDIDKEWIELFSDDELDQFWWPNQNQYEEIKKLFGDLPIKISSKEENPRDDWDIYSMFEAISGSEYELIGIIELNPEVYRLEFNPDAYPYGGTESLQKLVISLSHTVVAVDDGTGRVSVEIKKNLKTKKAKAWWKFW
jgi:hypothetical protein